MILLLLWCLEIYKWVLFTTVLISWIHSIPRYHPLVRFLRNVTEPVLRPLRQLLPPEKTGYIDFTPLIVFFVIQAIQGILANSMLPSRLID